MNPYSLFFWSLVSLAGRTLFPALLFAGVLPAWQTSTASIIPSLRGQLEGAADSSRVWVELVETSRNAMPMRTMPAPDGSFEFRGVPEGTYTVRVTTLNGELICERYEQIHNFGDQLTVRIPKRKRAEPVSGIVSYAQLKNPPPSKARRALGKAQKYVDSRKPAEARRSLEEAIRLFPQYTEAYANLGVLLVRTGQKEEALHAFEKALSIGPESAILQTNYAFALRALDRRADALKAASRAVDLDPAYLRGHYLLGSILAEKPETSEEAAPHLVKASAEVPEAHLHLAQIKARTGDRPGAILELEQYRSYAPEQQRPQIDRWVKALRPK